ncbi:alpha-1,2 galactosyltransferase [Histoplasma capsulatum var. duboisii H88]|uniref:Alpha-1,2 galactosyltransferase n=1 Tax=Ajellomyces capsulatus (strain H88) TaxID=544711 RepID=F0UCG8_AJEC8|nr:alpha-1,2 galactosyltransferase [Histoplasma capsulatum var. duboisii H88]QSS49429.1 alpha-1,2 galactosyltransferase [Histoplasma capsulatum var. duboisii H88]
MQFALPPRKPSHHVPYTRLSHSSIARRRKLKAGAILAFIAFSFLFLFSRLFSPSSLPVSSGEVVPAGVTNIVIVTVLDEDSLSDKYIQRIKQNREDYAKRHGYTNFFASIKEYLPYLNGAPRSWALIPALRHAYTLYPKASHFFHLSPHAVIMNPSLSLTSHILDNNRLESLMIKEKPVVPPDSVIKTFAHLKAKDVDFIISQDAENLCPGSFILRRTDWTRYFLDVWFDPLYRSYNFAKAEIHALDHIILWHPTLLAKLALIPQRIFNSYTTESPSLVPDSLFNDGDFIIRFLGCDLPKAKKTCEEQMEIYWTKWARETNNANL